MLYKYLLWWIIKMSNEYLFYLQHEYMHVCIVCVNIHTHLQKHLGSCIRGHIHVFSPIYVYSHLCVYIYTCTSRCTHTIVTLEGCKHVFYSFALFINRSIHMKGGIMYILFFYYYPWLILTGSCLCCNYHNNSRAKASAEQYPSLQEHNAFHKPGFTAQENSFSYCFHTTFVCL